jgi:SAM-dependent methyltransferase
MISDALLERVACPVCLEAAGCPRCIRPEAGPTDYDERVRCACGGPNKQKLERAANSLRCPACRAEYALATAAGYVDLTPRAAVGEVTQYADHEFHERLGVNDAPPLLSARVKADMMRGMLQPRAGESVLDLGCGAGKLALYAGRTGARPAGLDVAPFFLPRAASEVDLVLGDLRRVPFRNGAFPCAYTLDVLEHLDEHDLRTVLFEARRTIGRSGRLFVYTHAMESSRLASFQRAVNRFAKRLGARGLIDSEREALRKSDHKNAIQSHEHFDALCAEAGLRVTERRYYNVVFKAVVEDLLLRLYQGRHTAHAGPAHDSTPGQSPAPMALPAAPRPNAVVRGVGLLLTWLLKLDVVLFGGIRTGPFFGLIRPTGS